MPVVSTCLPPYHVITHVIAVRSLNHGRIMFTVMSTERLEWNGKDQSHKFKTVLNSFGSRVGRVLCNNLLFACLDKVKQIVNAKYRDAGV